MIQNVAIIGAGGFAREVLDILDACNKAEYRYNIQGFIVDPEFGSPGTLINDKPIIGGFDWLKEHKEINVIAGVGDPALRLKLVYKAKQTGGRFINIFHPDAIMTDRIEFGEGVIVTAGCILTNQIKVGNHVHINLTSTIGHDCEISDYVTISPGVHISGNVNLGEGCFIGTGVNIIEKINIGSWSLIGAGSAVVRDIPPNSTAVGVPAKIIKTKEDGWHLK